MGNYNQKLEKTESIKTPQFLLFGQPILTEQQMSHGSSSDAVSQVGKSSSSVISLKAEKFVVDWQVNPESFRDSGFLWNRGYAAEIGVNTGQCKVYLESNDVGRIIDLSGIGSYEELYKKLAAMFSVEKSEMESHVFYRDPTGAHKRTGDEPLSEFVKTAKKLTISTTTGNSSIGRNWVTGLPTTERGLDYSNQAGLLTIFT